MFVRCYFRVEWENWLIKRWKWRFVRVGGREGWENLKVGDGKGCVSEEFKVLWDRVGRK